MRQHFAITQGLRGGAAEGLPAIEQTLDFLDQPGGEHRLDAGIDAGIQLCPRPMSTNTRH